MIKEDKIEEWEETWNIFVKDTREYGDFPEILVSHIEDFIRTQRQLSRHATITEIRKLFDDKHYSIYDIINYLDTLK